MDLEPGRNHGRHRVQPTERDTEQEGQGGAVA
jgi:hypothetical protein